MRRRQKRARRYSAVSAPERGSLGRLVSAFTLIELLTVLGIISLLVALLSPALGRARRSAQQVKCGSNLRQLGLAAQMYWDDNDGHAFRWRAAALNGGQVYWFGWLQDGAEGQRQFDPSQSALFNYLAGRGVEICPSFRYVAPDFKDKAKGASYGYGYNLALSAPVGQPPVNVTKVCCPAGLAMLADAAQVNTFQAPASLDHPMLEEFYYVSTNEPTVHFRHGGWANAVFCDGHIAGAKPAANSLDGRLAGEIIGRLPLELLNPEE